MENLLNVRYMKAEDAKRVAEIEANVFSMPWSEKSFVDACNNSDNIYLVCECEGALAGYCGLWTSFEEGDITNVCVDDAYRRRGVAKALLEKLFEYAKGKGVNTFFLEVRESNVGAIALYEKLGFENVGVRKNFYEKPVENAIVMSKNVK